MTATQKGDFLLCDKESRPELDLTYRTIPTTGCTLTKGDLIRMANQVRSSEGHAVKILPEAIRRLEKPDGLY